MSLKIFIVKSSSVVKPFGNAIPHLMLLEADVSEYQGQIDSRFLYPITYSESCFSLVCFILVPWLHYSTLCSSWILLLPFVYLVK